MKQICPSCNKQAVLAHKTWYSCKSCGYLFEVHEKSEIPSQVCIMCDSALKPFSTDSLKCVYCNAIYPNE